MIMQSEKRTATFLVHTVRPGPGGGAVFFGRDDCGKEISAAFDYKWKGILPQPDQVWRVEGGRKPNTSHPDTIHAKYAVPVVPPIGELTRLFLLESNRFRKFGFGNSKLKKLEKGLATENVSVRDALNEGRIDLMSKYLPIGMVEKLVVTWRQSVKDFEIYEFLDQFGFDRSLATTVRKVFRENAADRLKHISYRMLPFGTPDMNMWSKAETAASYYGTDRKDPKRLAAAVEQALYDQLEEGHTLVPMADLRKAVMGLLKTKSDRLFEAAFRAAAQQKMIIRCDDGIQALGPASMEERLERKLAALANLDTETRQSELPPLSNKRFEELLSTADTRFAQINKGHLNPEQLAAVRTIYNSFLCVVTGAARTGKTTLLRTVHDVAENTGRAVYQMAMTDHAKVCLEEATGRKAFTIRAFIERLKKAKESPASKDVVVVEDGAHIIIDESNMADLASLHALLSLLPDKVRLSMIGDPGQLSPANFGVVFHLVVGVPGINSVELVEIVRQEDKTGIPGLSQSVRSGDIPTLDEFDDIECFAGSTEGVSFISAPDDNEIVATLYRVSEKLGHDCQVLCALKRFGNGSANRVNRFFQYHRQDAQRCQQLARWKMFVGDPVLVTRDSYDLNLFKGELGELIGLDGHISIFRFGKTEYKLNDEQMVHAGIELAYGITVQTVQGSKFNRVVVPVTKAKELDRSLIYTALTRAKHQVVFVGNKKLWDDAVRAEPKVLSISVGFDLRAALATWRR
jgi:exodeoxyribonuclease V alpha subunit